MGSASFGVRSSVSESTGEGHRAPSCVRLTLLLAVLIGVALPLVAQTTIFSDGFETGTVCRWSGGTPYPTVYVSATDPNATIGPACGLDPAAPCQTLASGLAAAVNTQRCEVDVAAATYAENVVLAPGIKLRGGFDPATWSRDPSAYPTTIEGTSGNGHRRAVSALAAGAAPTLLEGFVIAGAAATTPGANSYAVYVDLTAAGDPVTIRDNVIAAGDGAPGDWGSLGALGADGVPGEGRSSDPTVDDPNYDAFVATGTGSCDSSNDRQLANGAVFSCGADVVNGGEGGGNRCPPMSTCDTGDLGYGCVNSTSAFHWVQYSALNGAAGQAGDSGAPAASGGLGGEDLIEVYSTSYGGFICWLAPQLELPGVDGPIGVNGSSGSGCSASTGTVVAGDWVGGTSGAGTDGTDGGGGGGGGGGSGSLCEDLPGYPCVDSGDHLGGHGGGGGSGGCAGGGGAGGVTGGGSFGIFVVGTIAPVVTGNQITLAAGGTGGAGGKGGHGGAGGAGGAGGLTGVPTVFCAEPGADGGRGGHGGHGGGGGGGCGGVSYGIYTSGIGTPDYCQVAAGNTFSGGLAGAGGPGGTSAGNPGGNGLTGATGNCSFN